MMKTPASIPAQASSSAGCVSSANRVRVLHVLFSLSEESGGPLRAVIDLSARSLRFGLDSEILGFGPVNIKDNPLGEERIHSLPLHFPKRYCYSTALGAWLRAHLCRYDLVVIHGMWNYANWATAAYCRKYGIPYACFPHGMLEPYSVFGQGWFKALKKVVYWCLRERAIYRNAAQIFFATDREMRLARETFSLAPAQSVVIPYGVEIRLAPGSVSARRDLIQPPDRKVALFLGRVHPKKNVHFLLEVWRRAAFPPDWHLVVAGAGSPAYLSRLNGYVARHNLASHVHFVGHVAGQDKAYLLHRAQWFLLPSKQENFGVAVIEALAAGCPVAVSQEVYVSDMFHADSEVLPLTLDAWLTFMTRRMVDDAWRDHLRRLDQQYILPKFEMSRVSEDWAATIKQVFSRSESAQLREAS